MPGAPERAPHVRTVEVLPQIHQRQKSAQDPRLQIVREVQAAGRHARQSLSVFRNELHDLALAILRRVTESRLPAHLRAAGLQRQGEVKDAEPLLGKRRGRVVLASCDLARRCHVAQSAERLRYITSAENPVRHAMVLRMLHEPVTPCLAEWNGCMAQIFLKFH
jgi:hypothetical protein